MSDKLTLWCISLAIIIFFLGTLFLGGVLNRYDETSDKESIQTENVTTNFGITGVGQDSTNRYLWLTDGTHIQTNCPSNVYPFNTNSTHYKCGDADWVRVVPENFNSTNTKLGLSRPPDTNMTPEKLEALRLAWGEDEVRRMELNRVKPDNYEQMIINEFESGRLSHVKSCDNLHSYYLLFYGQVYTKQYDYSKNKMITDYIKDRMKTINCEFKELPELKEQIDLEKARIENATEKVMHELEEVNATSLEDVNVYD